LRRILGQVALKNRQSANNAERAAWSVNDLLFVSNYGEGEERQISFAHFSQAEAKQDLPTLKVLGWDNLDTALHLDAVAKELTENLAWPDDDTDVEGWRRRWRTAFPIYCYRRQPAVLPDVGEPWGGAEAANRCVSICRRY
jgi:hypothetical protein